MKFIALGRTHWLLRSIEACAARGHRVMAIVTAKPSPEYKAKEKDFQRLARKADARFLCVDRLSKETISKLAVVTGADVAISVNWPSLIPPSVLNLFEKGIINAHAGDLPRFRGNACPNWAILSGEEKVVLSLHRMAPDLDAGPIHAQRSFRLKPDTYIGDVYRFLDDNMPGMFADLLDTMARGKARPKIQSQRPNGILRCLPRLPSDGFLDWARSAQDLCRVVRATAEPFPGAFTYFGGEKLVVWRARSRPLPHAFLGVPGQVVQVSRERGDVSIFTGKGLLDLEMVEWRSSGRRKAADIIQSTRVRLGMDLPEEIRKLRERLRVRD